MKKLVLTFAAIIVAAGSFAQISGGLKAGINFANQKFETDGFSVSPDGRTAFHAGVYVNIATSDKLSIQPELLYNSVGSKVPDLADLKFDYLSLPIMVKYNVTELVNLHAGPQVGMLLSAKADDEDIKDSFKGIDFGLGIGAGVDLPMGLNFTARYTLGLSNISDEEGGEMKNNVFQISVGYRLFGGE